MEGVIARKPGKYGCLCIIIIHENVVKFNSCVLFLVYHKVFPLSFLSVSWIRLVIWVKLSLLSVGSSKLFSSFFFFFLATLPDSLRLLSPLPQDHREDNAPTGGLLCSSPGCAWGSKSTSVQSLSFCLLGLNWLWTEGEITCPTKP